MHIDTQTRTGYPLTVPCKGCGSLGKMLTAGKYDWVSPDLTEEHFPLRQKGTVQLLVHAADLGQGRIISNSHAQVQIVKLGLRPANIDELLSFGATYPEEQRKYPIVALGSVGRIYERQCVPFLATDRSSRIVGILAWEDEWSTLMRFLAVLERSAEPRVP